MVMHYEALCLHSRGFFIKQLYPLIMSLGGVHNGWLDVEMRPYGKALTEWNNGSFAITCQHGPHECELGKMHACANHQLSHDQALAYINCTMKDPKGILECGKEVAGDEFEKVKACGESWEGKVLMVANGITVHNLEPPLLEVPRVTLYGQFSPHQYPAIKSDWMVLLCNKWSLMGVPLPPQCDAHIAVYTDTDYSHYHGSFLEKNVAITTKTNSELIDLSPFYLNVFRAQKYQTVCTVQLISQDNLEEMVDLPIGHSSDEDSDFRTVHPNYVVILSKIHAIPLYFRISENMLSSIFLVLAIDEEDASISGVYINCFSCEKAPSFSQVLGNITGRKTIETFISLINLRHVPVSKHKLDEIWWGMHSSWNNLGVLLSDALIWGQRVAPPGSLKRLCSAMEIQHETEDRCLLNVILDRNNCTSQWCKNVLQRSFVFIAAIFLNSNLQKEVYMTPFGAQFDSLKFSLILGEEENQKGYSWKGLVSPFKGLTWLAILFIGFGLALFLDWFVIIEVFLEKGCSAIKSLRGGAICNIILGWLFCSFLIRNFYTSQMYSHLTKLPPPKNLPKSIKELLDNKTVLILSENSLASHLAQHIKFINEFRNISSYKLDPDFSSFRRIQVIKTRQQVSQFFKEVFNFKQIPCEALLDRRKLLQKNRTGKNCKTSGRFAFLSYSIGIRKEYSSRFLIPVLELFGNRQIYQSMNDLTFMSKPMMWFCRQKLFFWKQVQSQIGSLVDSGIYNWLRLNYDVRQQAEILRNISNQVGFGKGMNFFAYSVQKIKTNGNTVGKKGLIKQENMDGTTYETASLRMALFYEPLCPYSIIIPNQIYPGIQSLGGTHNPYVALDLNPYGKCNTTFEDGGPKFQCRRGDRDDDAYKIHNCVISENSAAKSLAYVNCTVSNRENPNAFKECADSTGLDFTRIESCKNSWEGTILFAAMGVKHRSLVVRPSRHPWVVFNDEYIADDYHRATDDFMGLVCEKLKLMNITGPPQCLLETNN
ncbi:unnamed protein product [Orchesella dallaii]|uniref:Gamma-interferon-inducible lysosomal thiol reductase n=1 Tax=Orchesella dallaii TaxID=48710 RepID=A0ABP1PJX0_9HEXA